MSFKITNLQEQSRIDLPNIDFRDLNKRFGRRGDYLEVHIHSLNNELLRVLVPSRSYYKLFNPD